MTLFHNLAISPLSRQRRTTRSSRLFRESVRVVLSTVAMLAGCVLFSPAASAAPPSPGGGVLDDDLLKDLLPPAQAGKAKEKSTPAAGSASGRASTSERPAGVPGKDGETPRAKPVDSSSPDDGEDVQLGKEAALRSLRQRMLGVERRLQQGDSTETTQATQAAIVAELDALLERQGRNRNSSTNAASSSASAGPQPPAEKPGQANSETPREKPNSDKVGGEAAATEPGAREMQSEVWGELPPLVREQLRNLAPEKFLPGYETMIEAFYRRLAEQRQP